MAGGRISDRGLVAGEDLFQDGGARETTRSEDQEARRASDLPYGVAVDVVSFASCLLNV